MASNGLPMSKVSEATGLTPRQVRHFETLGFIAAARTERKARRFSEGDIAVLQRIKTMLDGGSSMADVRVALLPKGTCGGGCEVGIKIGELAVRSGLTERMIRHYESLGIFEGRRSEGGTRLYGAEDLTIAKIVASLRASGVPLERIAALATERRRFDTGDAASQRLSELLAAISAELAAQIDECARLKIEVERASVLVGQCKGCVRRPNPRDCPDCPMERHKLASGLAQLIWEH